MRAGECEELTAKLLDLHPEDDPEAVAASLLGTLIGLHASVYAQRETGEGPSLQGTFTDPNMGGRVEFHSSESAPGINCARSHLNVYVDVTAARVMSRAEAEHGQGSDTATTSEHPTETSTGAVRLPRQSLEKVVMEPLVTFGQLLEWSEDCGLGIGDGTQLDVEPEFDEWSDDVHVGHFRNHSQTFTVRHPTHGGSSKRSHPEDALQSGEPRQRRSCF